LNQSELGRAAGGGHDVIVIGAGIAGLTISHVIARQRPEWSIRVLESSERVGGKVLTTQSAGYTFEHGATGFMPNRPATITLVKELGLTDKMTMATRAADMRFLYARGALHSVPSTLTGCLTTGLLSWRGKLRVAAEPFFGFRKAAPEQTVYEFAARRFGHEFASTIAATALQGLTAGDATRTSLRAALPSLERLDHQSGITGLLGLALRSRLQGRRQAEQRHPSLATFQPGGLQRLSEALTASLGGRVLCGVTVEHVKVGVGRRYAVVAASGDVVDADRVVVATPAHDGARMLDGLAPDVATVLRTIPFTGVRVLGLGYGDDDIIRSFEGFGFMAFRGDGLRILGVVASSNLFPLQAPPGRTLLRVFVGGCHEQDLVATPLERVMGIVRLALEKTLGITATPERVFDAGWEMAIPQYEREHLSRLQALDRFLLSYPGLVLAGNSYRSVGLDDTLAEAARLGRTIANGSADWDREKGSGSPGWRNTKGGISNETP
jgi:protoporphyrinogen/coproporphyrinogen III oxidase